MLDRDWYYHLRTFDYIDQFDRSIKELDGRVTQIENSGGVSGSASVGYAIFSDGAYSTSSPQSINAFTKTAIANDGSGIRNLLPIGYDPNDIFDDGRIIAKFPSNLYSVAFTMAMRSKIRGKGAVLTIENAGNVYFRQSIRFEGSAGEDTSWNVECLIASDSFMVADGVRLYVESECAMEAFGSKALIAVLK